jgi:6-phosphofructokinase 1
MGRDCGYLALMSGLATGAGWVLIPEAPPDVPDWEERMCQVIRDGHAAGRRHSTVVISEGARDRNGKPIEAEYVRQLLQEKLGLEVRTTVLGHVQRGGSPSAFDRIMGTLLGSAAVDELLTADSDDPPSVLGMHENRVKRTPLMECVEKTRSVGLAIADHDYERAMDIRGKSFKNSFRIHRTLVRALPHPPQAGQKRFRLAVMHSGAPAPGMNTAVRAAVRLGVDKGHTLLGVRNGFDGFLAGEISVMDWMSVHGLVSAGGAELGTNRKVPTPSEIEELGKLVEKNEIQGLLIIGGWAGYEAAYRLWQSRARNASMRIPIVCLPAAIDNNLPGTEYSIGADTALNSIVEAVDKIKQSAVAWRRCFVVEVMGRYCGYLAALGGLASGAERVYTHEEGISMRMLEEDLEQLVTGFQQGKRLGLMIRNENANPVFSTDFLRALFEEEGKGLFDAREAILGHLQQGGNPTPFDRIQATRMAARCIDYLVEEQQKEKPGASYIGQRAGRLQFFPLEGFPEDVDLEFTRPKSQWWISILPVLRTLAQPGPTRMLSPVSLAGEDAG